MALWDISFQIIIRDRTYLQGSEEMYAWNNSEISKSSLHKLMSEFETSKSWHEDIELIGSEDSILLKLSKIDENQTEISCKYNVVQESSLLTKKLLQFMKEINSIIFYENSFFEPEYDVFVDLIRNSEAAEFMNCPSEYFSKFSKKKEILGNL